MDKIHEVLEFISNIEISQIINLIIALASAIIALVLAPFISYGILKIFYRKIEKEQIKKFSLFGTLKTFFGILGFYIATKIISLNEMQDAFCDKCFEVVIIWSVARIVCGVFETRSLLLKGQKNKKNAFFTSVVSIVIKVILYIIALYLTLKIYGYDIGGIATGIGLTGAIVALGAQDFLKQIISGLAIFVDKPFEIDDWIDIDNISGTVEDITIKSIRVRTIEDTVVIVPNDLITSSIVINWGKISKRVYEANLSLALETPERTIEKLINRIKFILKYNEDTITNSIRVTASKINSQSLSIEVYLETTITEYIPYKEFCNKINLTLLNILDTQKVKLSYPRTKYLYKEARR